MGTLSVVVPAYNGAATIGDTLESLRCQTDLLAEILVIDDGSTDGTAEIAEAHPAAPRVIRLGRNSGVAFARNTGLLEATGDYVAYLDQDDLWLPTRAAVLLEALADDVPKVVFTAERPFAVEEDRDALMRIGHPYLPWIDLWAPRDSLLDLLHSAEPPQPGPSEQVSVPRVLSAPISTCPTFAVPRRLSLQAGGFPTWAVAADDWVLPQVLSRYVPIIRIDHPSVLYRIHPDNATLTVEWPLPLAVISAAMRFGGGIVPRDQARAPATVGRLGDSDFLMHHLEAAATEKGRRADAWAAWRLLATDQQDRRATARQLTRAAIRSTPVAGAARRLVRGLRRRGEP